MSMPTPPEALKIVIAMDDLGALGGITAVVQQLIHGFQNRGYEVQLMSYRGSDPIEEIAPFEYEKHLSLTADHPLAHWAA